MCTMHLRRLRGEKTELPREKEQVGKLSLSFHCIFSDYPEVDAHTRLIIPLNNDEEKWRQDSRIPIMRGKRLNFEAAEEGYSNVQGWLVIFAGPNVNFEPPHTAFGGIGVVGCFFSRLVLVQSRQSRTSYPTYCPSRSSFGGAYNDGELKGLLILLISSMIYSATIHSHRVL